MTTITKSAQRSQPPLRLVLPPGEYNGLMTATVFYSDDVHLLFITTKVDQNTEHIGTG